MNSTEVQNPQRKLYAYHNWFRWLTILSVALMLALCTLSCCCLYNVSEALILAMCSFMFLPVYSLFKMFQKISCLPYVFDSVLACAKPAHACVSEALLPALQTLSLSFLTNSSSDINAFQHFVVFSGSPTAIHHAFLFFDVKEWPQSQTDLFTCTTVFITLWAYLSQTRRPNYDITLWAYFPEPLVKDSHKSRSSMEKPQ